MNEEKIQAYVLGELPPEEAAEVAAAAIRDPKLAEMVEAYQRIQEGFRRQRVEALQQEFMAYDKTLATPTFPAPAAAPKKQDGNANTADVKPRRFPWWPLSILLLLLVAASWLFLSSPSTNTTEALSEEYFLLPPDPRTAGVLEETEELFQTALQKFFSGEYTAARASFSELEDIQDYQTDALLFLPHTAFLLEDYPVAETEFATALANPNLTDVYRSLLRWNAMINNLAQGRDIQGQLTEEWPANYRDRAKALLEALPE